MGEKLPQSVPTRQTHTQLHLTDAFKHIAKLLGNDHMAQEPRVKSDHHSLGTRHPMQSTKQQHIRTSTPTSSMLPPPYAYPQNNFRTPIQTFHKLRMTRQSSQTAMPQLRVLNHFYDNDGRKIGIDKLITNSETKDIWLRALDNELGRLASGFSPNNIKG